MRLCNEKCNVPVIMTPQAALSAFTENGTLRVRLIYIRSNRRRDDHIHWSMYKSIMQVNFDIVGDESSCSKLSPSLRVVPVVMSYDYSAGSSILNVFEDIGAQSLSQGISYVVFTTILTSSSDLTHLRCLNHDQIIHARPSGLHLSPQTFVNAKPQNTRLS